jgi:hypothetical protein
MSDPRECFQLTTQFLACLLLRGIARATPSITLSRKTGPAHECHSGFGPWIRSQMGVDIYFGSKMRRWPSRTPKENLKATDF